MTSEKALEQLKKSLNKLEIDYSVITSEKDIKISTRRDSVSVDCWYNSQQQTFGFTLVNGGIKSYTDIGEFEHYFSIYLKIYTVFIPRAKKIADTFEKTADIQTMYNSFKGSEASGYHSLFNVVGDDLKEIVISTTEKKNVFRLRYIGKVSSKDKGEVLADYEYKVGDDGVVKFLPNMKTYIAELANRYNQDNNVDIERSGRNECTYLVNDRLLTATIVFDDEIIEYLVTKYVVAGEEVKLTEGIKVELEDFYDVYALAKAVEDAVNTKEDESKEVEESDDSDDGFDFDEPNSDFDTYDDLSEKSSHQEFSSEDTESVAEEDATEEEDTIDEDTRAEISEENEDSGEENPEDNDAAVEISEETSESVDEEESTDEEIEVSEEEDTTSEKDDSANDEEKTSDGNTDNTPIETNESEEQSSMGNETENTAVSPELAPTSPDNAKDEEVTTNEVKAENEANNEPTDISLKIVEINGEPKFFRFDDGSSIYDVPVDLIDIPTEIVEDRVIKHKHKGMFITDEERKRRIFAKKVTDADKVAELLDKVFND